MPGAVDFSMRCPADGHEMVEHVRGLLDVSSCPSCRGVWVHHSEFVAFKSLANLLASDDGLQASIGSAIEDSGGESSAEATDHPCPSCGRPLERRHVDEIAVDACMACGGVWVERGRIHGFLPAAAAIRDTLPTAAETPGDTVGVGNRFDRFSFSHPLTYLFALPLATAAALIINATSFVGLIRPFHIWIHEFGHATIAWLAGRRALPLPIGWTSWQPDRSVIVYGALLFLLAVLFYTSWQEGLRGAMVLAACLAVIQLLTTWATSARTIELWITFGGMGGEFYLSVLLMVAFYFPMPDRWRWDFWRYVVLVIAASTFWDNFNFWNSVEAGRSEIPWGSILSAGDAGGDMDRLVWQFGWRSAGIVDAYNRLADACLMVLMSSTSPSSYGGGRRSCPL